MKTALGPGVGRDMHPDHPRAQPRSASLHASSLPTNWRDGPRASGCGRVGELSPGGAPMPHAPMRSVDIRPQPFRPCHPAAAGGLRAGAECQKCG
jgi:hypothetical protein